MTSLQTNTACLAPSCSPSSSQSSTSRTPPTTTTNSTVNPTTTSTLGGVATNLTPVVEVSRLRIPKDPASSSPSSSTQIVTVKRESLAANEEIKEFAETAMNELLGLYGYGPDSTKKISTAIHHNHNPQTINGMEGGADPASNKNLRTHHRQTRGTGRVNDRPTPSQAPEAAAGGSRSPLSLSNSPPRTSPVAAVASSANENHLGGCENCDWCHRKINLEDETYGTTESGVRFCSEPCFAQSRRATFKRAKTCDWCRHVRHAVVSYVDFQDGASQLQFCSDKCLNQYKMQIFIKETQAHLEMNPHLMEHGEGSGSNLITPELWLKNCRSRSASPALTRSRSPTPERELDRNSSVDVAVPVPVINRPKISVAPVSKLLPPQSGLLKPSELMASRPSMKTMRKRRTLRNGPPVRDHLSSFVTRTVGEENSQNLYRPRQISPGPGNKMPPNHEIGQQQQQQHQQQSRPNEQMNMHPFDGRFLSPPPNLFPIRHHIPSPMSTPGTANLYRHQPMELNSNNSLPPMPNLRPAANIYANCSTQRIPELHPPPHQQQPFYASSSSPFMNTLLVPCPIILPIPVPIPIPINMLEFLAKILESKKPPESSAQEDNSDLNNNSNLQPTTNHSETRVGRHSTDAERREQDGEEGAIAGDRKSDSDEYSENDSTCDLVPKVKITRLQSKRILTTRELDSSRPLRKRKRIVVDSFT